MGHICIFITQRAHGDETASNQLWSVRRWIVGRWTDVDLINILHVVCPVGTFYLVFISVCNYPNVWRNLLFTSHNDCSNFYIIFLSSRYICAVTWDEYSKQYLSGPRSDISCAYSWTSQACLYMFDSFYSSMHFSSRLIKKNDEPMQSKDIVYFLYSVSKSSCFKY